MDWSFSPSSGSSCYRAHGNGSGHRYHPINQFTNCSLVDDRPLGHYLGNMVTAGSGVCCGTNLSNMFGGGVAGGEGLNTLFGPQGGAAGVVYFIEWMTTPDQTIRSFHLQAFHDGGGDPGNGLAERRGISQFRLFAFNSGTSAFDILLFDLVLDLGINPDAFGGPAPSCDPTGLLSSCRCVLDFLANVDTLVTTNKWRAEFTQFGFASTTNSTPRIVELDGFNTFLDGSSGAEPIPEPATLLLFGTGLVGLGFVRRRKRT